LRLTKDLEESMFGWFKKGAAEKEPAPPKAKGDLASVISLHLAGDLESARKGYLDLLELGAGKAPGFLLATVLVQQDRLDEALSLLDAQGQSAQIVAEIQAAAGRAGTGALLGVMLAAGDILKGAGQANLSCAWYKTATELDPHSAEALYRYADTLHDLRLYNEAEQALKAALALDPEHFGSCYTYGVLQQDLGRDNEAIDFYQRALKINDQHAKLHNNLGSALVNVGRSSEALPHFQRAVQLDERLAHAHSNMGTLLHMVGHWRGALAAFENAMAVGAPVGIWVKHALVLPPIPSSPAEIKEVRSRLESELSELRNAKVVLRDPVREVGMTPFYLAYHGLDDLSLMRQLAGFYSAACPQLSYIARHCLRLDKGGEQQGKIRIGFLSTFLYDHTVGRYIHQVIRKLSREQFEVVAISTFAKKDEVTRGILEEVAETVTIPTLLPAAQQAIGDARLDVLVFADIGMEPLTYFLGFARLAPVQIAFYGHPDTTGLPNIDYFLSHEGCEPPESDRHYSERLLCLSEDVAYTYFDRPVPPAVSRSRGDFGLDQAARLYLCPQSLFKIHPEMDGLFAGVLNADPKGVLVLFEKEQPAWTELLRERLKGAGTDLERVRFLPRVAYGEYLELLRLADVVLDTVHFSGGATTLDALAMGTPIVTLPGQFMRGRQTLGCYRRLDIDDCIAGSAEEYVEKAVKIASDRELRAELSRRILDAAPELFEDLEMVREFELLVLEAHANRG